jgi:acyl-CoA thioester hydrolase
MTEHHISETTFYVRYAETDQMSIVHHAAYIIWFEEGRSAWLRETGRDYADFEASGLYLAASEVQARYLAPALYGRQVTVRTWVEEVRSRTLKFCYEVLDTESRQKLVTGHTRHICIDREGKVARIPQAWRELLSGQ